MPLIFSFLLVPDAKPVSPLCIMVIVSVKPLGCMGRLPESYLVATFFLFDSVCALKSLYLLELLRDLDAVLFLFF